jgi:methylthioribose-1-phosphate isomerase
MNIDGQFYRTVWIDESDPSCIRAIDQSRLPHFFEILSLRRVEDFTAAIKNMNVRGAGCIGATAAYGMYAAALQAGSEDPYSCIEEAAQELMATRPTASNLAWAVRRMKKILLSHSTRVDMQKAARREAEAIADEDAAHCREIGILGADLIGKMYTHRKNKSFNILTHCNAGWLAFVDYGSATAPIYEACRRGLDIHVWVDMTGPRNQGSRLTAWELSQEGVPHTIIPDNTGGHLMQHGMVDMVITGADRVTRRGDAANKIGTYLKAVAARDNGIPLYVALPSSTFDFSMYDGIREIPIEMRDSREVTHVSGITSEGDMTSVRVAPAHSPAANWGFDVTPAHLITGLISERGICRADESEILSLFPEHDHAG